ncbi:PIG-L family deacetylase [Hymenobacter busanensis]|uniref:PIG-L family deacetylase n=1 Tax=Hymenobacter busanensis TaxID=2607656 RepID=A0A7L4ZY10_9BACT|nr:PIG-L deacetylase family protein [Hymenobacter busanensis]KAA9325292.1 PIG-L family deacetylase [Hymenobacter busanensis]QHJ07715.1 PIG-L family deacetylase [Hymenobacter busanensis]
MGFDSPPPLRPAALLDLPLRPPGYAASLGTTAVIIPHPDDESLGCGGLLALLRQAGQRVVACLVTDGTMSHPHSVRFPPDARRQLREQELREALRILGVADDYLLLLNLPDGNAAAFAADLSSENPTNCLRQWLLRHRPATLLLPWRRDPHPDHRATYYLTHAALADFPHPPRVLEYVVWAWERAAPDDLPRPDEATGWRLDISPVLGQKQEAMAAHRSQLTNLIDDDPSGFRLSSQMLAHFAQPFETYFEGAKPSL